VPSRVPISGERRHEILRVAMVVLADRGYDKVTFDGVSELAHVSKPTLYSHWAHVSSCCLHKTPKVADIIEPHRVGTLHHLYVISGRLRTGPVSEPVEVAGGDFVRFPGDVPHRHVCLTERVVAHLVTTVPQVRQFGPTVLRPQVSPEG
jgi:mannose-6-phosphate isomerase-like protein (cupin superfamily)